MCKISVIVPNYNHAKFLKKRLDSILNQTCQDFELILLDDCSTDDSSKVLGAYANHPKVKHLIVNLKNSGSPFAQWDKGIKLAKGEYIWIAESDDWSRLDFLDKMVSGMESNMDVLLAYCSTILVEDEIERKYEYDIGYFGGTSGIAGTFCMDGELFADKYLSRMCIIPNVSGVMIRRSGLSQIDYQAIVGFKKSGDWILYWKLAKLGKVLHIDETMNYFRRHPGATTDMNSVVYLKEKMKIVRYFLSSMSDVHLRYTFLMSVYDEFLRKNVVNLPRMSILFWYVKLDKVAIKIVIDNLWKFGN